MKILKQMLVLEGLKCCEVGCCVLFVIAYDFTESGLLRPTDVADESVLSVSRSTLWLLFNLFASAFALKEEKVFTWMYMSAHTQEGMITFADTKCSNMRAYFHQL